MSCWMSSSRLQTTFTGPSTCCAISTAQNGAVDFEPAAEAAAEKVVVDLDRILRQAGDLGDRGLGQGRRLGADPDVAAVLADMNGAVHRLHRRMRQERQLIDGVDRCAAPASAFVRVAVVARDLAGLLRRLVELANDVGAAEHSHADLRPIGSAAAASPFLAAPIWSATTATASSMLHHLAHARDRTRRRFVDVTATLPPNTGEIAIAAISIPGSLTSMPNCARAVDLERHVQALADLPSSVKSFGSLSVTLSGAGTGSAAAASASAP